MVERSEPERVEVELTSDAPAHDRWRRRSRDPSDARVEAPTGASVDVREDPLDDSGDDSVVRTETIVGGPAGSPRRAVVAAVATGVVGLSLGWMLGGSSGSADQTDANDERVDATAPSVASTGPDQGPQNSDGVLTPIEPVGPTTTVRRTTTTTTLPPTETVEVVLNEKLAGADFRLVGILHGSGTAEIDVATSSMSTHHWGAGPIEPYSVVIGEDWVVATRPSGGSLQLLTPDGATATPNLGDPWSLLWITGTDLFWRGSQEPFSGRFAEYQQVDLDGTPTGPTIEARGTWPFGVDPAGGVLTVANGSTYSLREDGVTFVGSGELLAISAERAVLRSCDEQLVCGLDVVDRMTGDRARVPMDADLVPDSSFNFGTFTNEISPDGGAVGLFIPTDRGIRLIVVDLVTGAVEELPGNVDGPGGVTWSPDGRFGVFLQGSTPMLYDRDTGEVEPVGDDIGAWAIVEIRPSRA